MNINSVRLIAGVLSGVVTSAPAFAQAFASLSKASRFVQTGPNTVVPDTSGQGAFQFGVFVDSNSAALAPSFTPPNGTARPLAFDAGDGEWGFEQSFTSQAALT